MYSSLTNSEVGSSSSPNATDLTPKPMPCENVYKVPLNEEVPESLRPFTPSSAASEHRHPPSVFPLERGGFFS